MTYSYNRTSTDRSDNSTVVEYAVREMFKGKSIENAAKITVKKHSGWQNPFFGPGITTIDAKKLVDQLWIRMADACIRALKSFKEDKADWALDSTLDQFRQKPSLRAKLRDLVVKRLGRDPFPENT